MDGVKIGAILRAVAVFAFFAFLALQVATGFMDGQLLDADLKPTRAGFSKMVRFLNYWFVQPFGRYGGAFVLTAIGTFCSWLAYRRGMREGEEKHGFYQYRDG